VQGLAGGGVLATGKHFPGLGYAQTNTDNVPTIVRPALLIALTEVERQVHKGFRTLEKEIEHL